MNFLNIENLTLQDEGWLLVILTLLGFILMYVAPTPVRFHLRKWVKIWVPTSIESYKHKVRILFIDDNDIPMARNLADNGWNVEKIEDAEITDDRVKRANVIFVDWKGVGTRISAEQEGVSLANLLKKEYGAQKFIILYTVLEHLRPEGVKADDWIRKGSDIANYLEKIDRAAFVLAL